MYFMPPSLQEATAMSSCSCWRATKIWDRMKESCSCSAWSTLCWLMILRLCGRTSGRCTDSFSDRKITHEQVFLFCFHINTGPVVRKVFSFCLHVLFCTISRRFFSLSFILTTGSNKEKKKTIFICVLAMNFSDSSLLCSKTKGCEDGVNFAQT